MNQIVGPQGNMPKSTERQINARCDHAQMTALVTKAALEQQAEAYRYGITKIIAVINEISLLLEAYSLRNGNSEFVEQIAYEMITDLREQHSYIYELLGVKMLDVINSIPSQPHVVGFWEEVGARFLDRLFGEKPPDRDFLDELRKFSDAAKKHMSSTANATIAGIKETLNSQHVKGESHG